MKKILFLIIALIVITSCKTEQPTEIIVIGNLHKPASNYNPEILFNILENLQPDFILHEIDSSFFTSDFKFSKPYDENEGMASKKYIEKYPATQLRPYEFEGRNQYRRDKGMRPTDRLTLKLLDSLSKVNLLTTEQSEIFNTYQALLEPLKVRAAKSPEHFNNPQTDSICERRQFYQYQMIPKITNVREEFSKRFVTKPNGEKISYRNGYQLWADFWDTRNKTMAKNILKISEQNKEKRIVVLTGFMHRYYLLKELKRLTKGEKYSFKEFYE
ncbi:hypothetical protein [Ichthyenterobacterium magnum]|uniref:TraB family protein n=1 Tax=Ichthyenterobacterium magnum TaxID=1230530 RepID=A0A420DVD2_9FLAO|nr:hypothetical protein [Ichthyenterobacterium magnum]RKE98137.1 hypothetical protein BXY80_0211 [Ichthyenterobacterium magnum]